MPLRWQSKPKSDQSGQESIVTSLIPGLRSIAAIQAQIRIFAYRTEPDVW